MTHPTVRRAIRLALSALSTALAPTLATATLVQENWDYATADQTSITQAASFNGGSNWHGPLWTSANEVPVFRSRHNLAIALEGWSNANGPVSGCVHGRPGSGNGGDQHRIERRVAASDLTGAFYLAFLVSSPSTAVNTLAVFFDGDPDIPGGGVGLAFYGSTGFMLTNAGNTNVRNSGTRLASVGNLLFSISDADPKANLIIAKFEADINAAGHDRITVIQNPLDVTSEALAIQTAQGSLTGYVHVHDPGQDIWGAGLSPTLAISARGDGSGTGVQTLVDQIRVAHGTSGWNELVAPSPPPALLLHPGGPRFLDQMPYSWAVDRGGADPLTSGALRQNQTDTGGPIVIGGNTPDHGLFARESKVQLSYLLKRRYSGFATDIWRSGGNPGLQVIGDGRTLFEVPVVPAGEVRRAVVDVSGVEILEVAITDGAGDGVTGDKLSLGNPRLIQKPVVGLTPWEAWRHTHFPGALHLPDAVSGPAALSNGLPNIIRYALGMGVTEYASAALATALVDGRLQMKVPVIEGIDPALARAVSVSPDLGRWVDLVPLPPVEEGGRMVLNYRDTEALPARGGRFMRFASALGRPVARMTAAPVTGAAPLAVAFDGSASSTEGGISRYTWSFGDGQTEALAPAPRHTYELPGIYEVALEAADASGGTGVARQNVVVLPPGNQPPRARIAASSRLVAPGGSVSFDASASSDFDGTITAYAWSFDDGTTATGPAVTRTFPSIGFVRATLTVIDDDGATAGATVRVRIDPGDNSTIFPIRQGSRILFIGNSLIGFFGPMSDGVDAAVNHVPGFDIEPGGAGKGQGTLMEYANWPSLGVEAIIQEGWDIVIIQPWVEVLSSNLADYETAATTLVGWVRASGAEPLFYIPQMEWAKWLTAQPTAQRVIQATAARLGASFIDVTAAWGQVLEDYPNPVSNGLLVDSANTQEFSDLLYSDGGHQSGNGMALNVYLVYRHLTGLSPVGLAPVDPPWPTGMTGGSDGLTPALQAYLQGVANQHGSVSPFVP